VHAIAEQEGMPDGLKITNKAGIILYDSSWLPGVDYDDDEEYQAPATVNSDEESDEDEVDLDDEQYYDRVDPDELADLLDDQVHPHQQQDPVEIAEEDDEDEAEEHVPTDIESPEAEDTVDEVAQREAQGGDQEEAPADAEDQTTEEVEPAVMTRSGREVRVPSRYREVSALQSQSNTDIDNHIEYGCETVKVIAHHICAFNEMAQNTQHRHHSFIQTYSLKAGLKKFGEAGKQCAVFHPVPIESLTAQERARAMENLILMTEKRVGTVKERTSANDSVQREKWMSNDDATSPTVMTASIFITVTIEAAKHRNVMAADIFIAFVQTPLKKDEGGENIIIDMLVELDPNIYKDHRDNQSAMKLEQNGKASCGKRTRHFNIKYFYITDLIQRKEVFIEYCPTEQMITDFMTKPLTGKKFQQFRKIIMNLP
jgi:hypothetical protein